MSLPFALNGGTVVSALNRGVPHVLHHDVRAVLREFLGLADPVHPDNEREVTSAPGRDPGLRVLEDGGLVRADPEVAGDTNCSPVCRARWRRKSSNICFQAAA